MNITAVARAAFSLLLAGAGAASIAAGPSSAPGRLRGPSHADEPPPVRISLRMPARLPKAAARMSMQVQIEENRFYRFEDLKPGATVDLGPLERGWNPFRFFNIRLTPPGQKAAAAGAAPGLWCSGGFEARPEAPLLQVSMVEEGGRLRCSVEPVPPATAVRP